MLALALVAASSAAASAGTYLGLGIGTAPDISSNDQMMTVQGNGRSGKLLLGMRFGRLSVEGAAARAGAFVSPYGYAADSTQLSAALKYSFPLGDNFEAFLRGGLEHTSLSINQSVHSADDASGNGWLLGGGFEYRLNALIAGGSLFVDYEHVQTNLTNNENTQFETSSGIWMAGVTLSL
ncbi:MAG: outer membrane beta-barrel protein [Acidobacteriota bacterium]